DIGGVDSGLRRGRTSIRGASRQYPTNTGKVPPLLALLNDGHDLFFGVGTDIAKISRKRSKSDNHGHGNGIEYARAGRMLSKGETSHKLSHWPIPTRDDTEAMKETHQGLE
ncbi:hypothetical protein Tco_1145670, partial [Tanacetum coccineum]